MKRVTYTGPKRKRIGEPIIEHDSVLYVEHDAWADIERWYLDTIPAKIYPQHPMPVDIPVEHLRERTAEDAERRLARDPFIQAERNQGRR